MKLRYQEGSVFALPLEGGGFGTGLVARTAAKGKVVLCYFFGPRLPVAPTLEAAERIASGDAVHIARVGDLFLQRGRWDILGRLEPWERSKWPVPLFARRDPIGGRVWLACYSDDDAAELVSLEPFVGISEGLRVDSVLGAQAAELVVSGLVNK